MKIFAESLFVVNKVILNFIVDVVVDALDEEEIKIKI